MADNRDDWRDSDDADGDQEVDETVRAALIVLNFTRTDPSFIELQGTERCHPTGNRD